MRRCWRPRLVPALLTLLVFVAIAYAVNFLIFPPRFNHRTFAFASVDDNVCGDEAKGGASSNHASPGTAATTTIPNLVHYVWLLQNPDELRLSFTFFVSVYSAHYFWQPERIYLHTDASDETVARAREAGTPWTKRVLAVPGVTLNRVEAPQATRKGVPVPYAEHKSDFVRLEMLRKFGGVYLDSDAMPLRDIADLRNSGFRNVIGQQMGLATWFTGYLNNGVMMAVPGSNLMTIFYHAAHEFFDGRWDTASIRLLTDLGNRAAAIPGEVLILQPQAFTPTSWEYEDQRRLFLEALDPSKDPGPEEERQEQLMRAGAVESGTCRDLLAWIKQHETIGKAAEDAWQIDFSSSYILHAVDNHVPTILGEGRGIDVKYILARKSNYARALFPAVWNAVQEGIIPHDEVS